MASHTPDIAGTPALIQPHGFLIGVTPDWTVAYASANIGDFLASCGASPVGQLLADVLGDEAVHSLRNQLSLLRDPMGSARVFALHVSGANRPIDIQMHTVGDDTILEAQPATRRDSGDPIGLVRALATHLDGHDRLDALLDEGARQLRALTGFADVSLFRWTDGGAEIAAHCARGDLAPAPLPVSGALRLIVDAAAPGVAIEPDIKAGSLDGCLLHAAGPDDRAAMDSSPSFVRLPLIGGALNWGVAVCLNPSPRHLGLERLAATELFCDLLALHIALLETRD